MNLGKGIIEDFDPHLDFVMSPEADHTDWPVDRRYKLSYKVRGNGGGFSKPQHVYFDNEAQIKQWERREARCSRPADSSVEYTVYEWYLGPKVLKHNWF